MSQTRLAVAVVMERTPLADKRWQSEKWEPIGVVPDSSEPGAAPRALVQSEACAQWLHPGFELELFHDEAEGYYLNLSSQKPFVFVNWLEEEGAGVPDGRRCARGRGAHAAAVDPMARGVRRAQLQAGAEEARPAAVVQGREAR